MNLHSFFLLSCFSKQIKEPELDVSEARIWKPDVGLCVRGERLPPILWFVVIFTCYQWFFFLYSPNLSGNGLVSYYLFITNFKPQAQSLNWAHNSSVSHMSKIWISTLISPAADWVVTERAAFGQEMIYPQETESKSRTVITTKTAAKPWFWPWPSWCKS